MIVPGSKDLSQDDSDSGPLHDTMNQKKTLETLMDNGLQRRPQSIASYQIILVPCKASASVSHRRKL